MPKSITTFCTASRSHLTLKTRTSHVWVSEDVLSETFATFVRNHKRYGSNVPGPLEARKRASRRRATHLAHQSATNYSPESFGLFETQSQQGWWQETRASPEHQAGSWQWPFLFPHAIRAPPQPRPPPKPIGFADELDDFENKHGKWNTEDTKVRLRKHLGELHTHTAAMDLLADLSISLKHTPQLAAEILRHMIAEKWEYEEIAEFLLDPRSNTAGTTNHFYVLEHAQEHADLVTWLLHRNTISKAARLALLSVTEIQEIVLLIPKIDPSLFPESSTWALFCIQFMNAIDQSKLLNVRDLGEDFIHRWLGDISLHSFCPAVPELLWRLHKMSQKLTGSGDENALESVIHTSISMVKETTISHLHDLVDFLLLQPSEQLGPVIFSLTNRLYWEAALNTPESLSTTELQQQVDRIHRQNLLRKVRGTKEYATRAFDESAELDANFSFNSLDIKVTNGEVQATPTPPEPSAIQALCQQRLEDVSKLELWYAVLGNLGITPIDRLGIHKNTIRKHLYDSVARGEVRQRSLVATWVWMVLSIHKDTLHNPSTLHNAIEKELCRTFFAVTEKGRESILVDTLRALQLSPLPAKNKLLRRLYASSINHVGVKRNYWDLSTHLNHIENARILELCNDNSYQSIKQHFPHKLTEMVESINTDMPRFERTCIEIINHSKGSTGIIFRLLDNNEELKSALRKAGAMKRILDQRERVEAAKQPALGGYQYFQLVEMIHNFAREISRSQQLSPRNALRKTWSIRYYLISCQAPVQTGLAKALWHAGVTRYDDERAGSCYHNVRWLYDMIVEQSGEAEADRMLHRSGKADVPDLHNGLRTCEEDFYEGVPQETDEATLFSETQMFQRFWAPPAKVYAEPFCSPPADIRADTRVRPLPVSKLPASDPPITKIIPKITISKVEGEHTIRIRRL